MAYQVKTTKNYGNRLLDSLKGAGAGFIILFVGTIMLCANEGNYVKTDKAIRSAQNELVKVSDISTMNPSLDGKLIHAYAFADTQDVLSDDLFGASEKAIALVRLVEYYQYEEHSKTEKKDKLGGSEETTTTYTYEKKWVTSPINSAGFTNPDYKKSNIVLENDVKSQLLYAKNVSFGAYKLPAFIIEEIKGSVPVETNISAAELAAWSNRIAQRAKSVGYKADSNAALAQVVQGNIVYFGRSPSSPQIGDVRITLAKVPPANISIIARVIGPTFERYLAPNGRTFTSVAMGMVSAETMIESAKKANSFYTWLLRIIGIILVVAAFKMIFKILPTLFKVLPPLATIVGAGVTLVCSVGGFAWSLVVISLAWLFYRPLIGIPMLLIAVAGIWFLKKKAKEKAALAPAAAAAPGTANTNTVVTADGWTCACGTVNKGKFCVSCGKPKPAGIPQYKCDKCGWEPQDKAHPPKFCPTCGDPFDDGDIVK